MGGGKGGGGLGGARGQGTGGGGIRGWCSALRSLPPRLRRHLRGVPSWDRHGQTGWGTGTGPGRGWGGGGQLRANYLCLQHTPPGVRLCVPPDAPMHAGSTQLLVLIPHISPPAPPCLQVGVGGWGNLVPDMRLRHWSVLQVDGHTTLKLLIESITFIILKRSSTPSPLWSMYDRPNPGQAGNPQFDAYACSSPAPQDGLGQGEGIEVRDVSQFPAIFLICPSYVPVGAPCWQRCTRLVCTSTCGTVPKQQDKLDDNTRRLRFMLQFPGDIEGRLL